MNKFLAIDIETTGLNEEKCQVLEVGVVVGDYSDTPVVELPCKRWRLAYDYIIGEPFALKMNAKLIEDMCTQPIEVDGLRTNYSWNPASVIESLAGFMDEHKLEKASLAGKNVGSFDLRFLRRMPSWAMVRHHHRILDPGMLWKRRGEVLTSDTVECIKRAGLEWDTKKLHSAIWDCRLVIELLRAGEKQLAGE
jgi:oligoribonuclease